GLRVSMPCASFFLALMALPLGIQPPRMQRAWGAGLSAVIGMLVFVIYYGLLSVGITLAEARVVPSTVALWLPNFILVGVSALTIHRIASEQWHSIAAGFESIGDRLTLFFTILFTRLSTRVQRT